MRHEVTFISDDVRFEVGKKITLAGLYDEAIIFRSLPSRILKLAVYQRWRDIIDVQKVVIEIRGSAMGDVAFRVEGKPTAHSSKEPHPARITLQLGPIDFLKEGEIEFLTFFNDDPEPRHNHKLAIRVDANLNLDPF
jgi:hypothetical protein